MRFRGFALDNGEHRRLAMKFNKNKVYTAVNAEDLKAGSKIIVSNNISSLESYVLRDFQPQTLEAVRPSSWCNRFKTEERPDEFALAYLVAKPSYDKRALKRAFDLFVSRLP